MSAKIGTATDYADLLNVLDTFLTSTGMALTPSFTGTGDGTIDALGGSAGVAETITVTFTSATAFGVVGSVSGSLGTGAVGTPFTSTKVNFTVTAGGTAFVATDVFTFAVTPPWTSHRRVSGSEMIWQAPGNGGLDEIIVGAAEFHDAGADYWNWRLGGFTAYNSGAVFNQQPGYIGGPSQSRPSPVFTLWNSSIPYWIIANGRRVIVIAKISTVYVAMHLGFLASYMAPGSFPYPLIVGGNLAFLSTEPAAGSASWRWSYTGNEMRNFPIPFFSSMSLDSQSTLMLRLPSGSWRGFDVSQGETQFGAVWPFGYVDQGGSYDWRPNLDGGYPLLPIVLFDQIPNVYGELEGIHATAGFSQAVENTITVDRIQYLVVQNVFRNTKADFFAVRLS
ncbi:MAG: hypothetical protein ACRD59_10515 [Candidatus Acidiferrales bacterium]